MSELFTEKFINKFWKPSLKYSTFYLLLYLSTIFLSNYIMISDENYIENVLKQIEEKIDDKRIVEITRDGMEALFRNPGLITLSAMKITIINAFSLALLVFILWFILSFLTDTWKYIYEFIYACSITSIILTIGVWLDTVVKLFTDSFDSHFGIGIFLNIFQLHPLLGSFVKNFNLFSILFLVTLSIISGKIFKESFTTLLSVIALCWLSIILIAYLFGFHISIN
jgi:hypothetical protein